MAFASFPSNEMRPTALLLNIVAATYSTWLFNRGSLVDWAKLRPLLLASLPTALVGGFIVLDERLYNAVTGIVLLLAGAIFSPFAACDMGNRIELRRYGVRSRSGQRLGFVSGLTGVGGGVFLAPILIALHWASPKQTAALSAPFILANSVVGLMGAMYAGQTPSPETWLYALAALSGAMIGTTVGLRWLSQTMTRYALVVVLANGRYPALNLSPYLGLGLPYRGVWPDARWRARGSRWLPAVSAGQAKFDGLLA